MFKIRQGQQPNKEDTERHRGDKRPWYENDRRMGFFVGIRMAISLFLRRALQLVFRG